MIGGNYIDKRGVVRLAPNVGDREPKITHYSYEDYDKEEINLCLNCKKPKCTHPCDTISEHRHNKGKRSDF